MTPLTPTRARRIRRRVGASVLAATMATAACSGGGGGSAATTTTTTEPEPVERVLPVDVTVAYAGFDVTVDDVTVITDDEERGVAVVTLDVVNPGPEAEVPLDVVLRRDGNELTPAEVTPPTLAAGGRAEIVLRFLLGDDTSLADAFVVFGPDGTNRPEVEILPDPETTPGELAARALVPRRVSVDRAVTAGGMTLVVDDVVIRHDDPATREQLVAGRALLVVSFDARRTGGATPNIGSANLRWRLPGDTVVPVRPDGRSSPNLLLDDGGSAAGVVVRFEVPTPVEGVHTLVLIGPFDELADEVRGELELDLDIPDAAD